MFSLSITPHQLLNIDSVKFIKSDCIVDCKM